MNLEVDPSPGPVGPLGAQWQPFWILQAVQCCSQCGITGSERVPMLPMGGYLL